MNQATTVPLRIEHKSALAGCCMGVSETILAAMIGALATISTALFQLVSAFKSRDKADPRAKQGSKLRSLLSIAALMVASAVGGFLYSEFLKQRGGEQMQALRAELREVKELAALVAARSAVPTPSPSPVELPTQPQPHTQVLPEPQLAALSTETEVRAASQAEALIYVPTCQPNSAEVPCREDQAQRVALCSTIPVTAQITNLELFAQPDASQQPWEQHAVALEQDVGGARFTGKSFEYGQAATYKAVCINFLQWNSTHPYLARMIVHYGPAAALAAPNATATTTTTGVDPTLEPQTATFMTPQLLQSK